MKESSCPGDAPYRIVQYFQSIPLEDDWMYNQWLHKNHRLLRNLPLIVIEGLYMPLLVLPLTPALKHKARSQYLLPGLSSIPGPEPQMRGIGNSYGRQPYYI